MIPRLVATLFVLSLLVQSTAVVPAAQEPAASVPRLLAFSGIARTPHGQPLSGTLTMMFVVYAEPDGGVPLWSESHTVRIAAGGRYDVLLGSATDGGVPAELFVSGGARWVAVHIEGGPEQAPR